MLSYLAHLILVTPMLKVLVVNDDFTPTEFVVSVLQDIFGHSKQVAEKTALLAHLNGKAVCGIYREYVEANSLVSSATALSRQRGYPLGFVVLPLPFWERVAGCVFKWVMKVTPGYDVFYY
jgi:ATP-dependent Clp protease adaptor protein ClpS